MKLVITGASGRMGRMLIETALNSAGVILYGALDSIDSASLGKDAGEFLGKTTGVMISHDAAAVLAGADCVIDFTRPEATLNYLPLCVEHGVNLVTGTTGFDEAGKTALQKASESIGVVFSPNMAIGVNATFKILELAAKILSSGYDIEIIEAHHKMKVDAPSGTALKMGEVVAGALGRDLKDCAVYGREGHTGVREDATIGFSTIRGGDIIGDHTVLFAGMGERIEVTHKSSSRQSYATGAVRAALYLDKQSAGWFDMHDVLGLNDITV
jgi:4-hydroxy-tetrahydrodipicolinate reductase